MQRSRCSLLVLALVVASAFATTGVALADEPTATPAALPLLPAALEQTFTAETFRFRYDMYFSDPYREIQLLTMDGEHQGSNSRATLGGALAEFSGSAGSQSILYGDKHYFQADIPGNTEVIMSASNYESDIHALLADLGAVEAKRREQTAQVCRK